MSCALGFSVFTACTGWGNFKISILSVFLTGLLIFVNKYLAIWFDRGNKNQKYVSNSQVLLILLLIMALSMFIEYYGIRSTFPCFLIGVMFPKEGKTTRTLLHKLTYAVHEFILPIYFGFTGFQFDVDSLNSVDKVVSVLLMVMLSIAGKIIGTLAACHYLKIPHDEGVILAFILNMKGNADLVLIDVGPDSQTWWNRDIQALLLTVIVLNTLVSGPVVSFILARNDKYTAHYQTSLEFLDPESELQMVSCVYGPRNAPSQLGLISALLGIQKARITPHLMHLVEIPKRRNKRNLMYHQLEDGDQFSDEDDYGGDDVLEINNAIDTFTAETKILIHQIRIVSSFPKMYDDVCTRIKDLRVSIIFLPFHKHRRIDGKLENGKEGMRTNNQKILRYAPCSVGILVDKQGLEFQKLVNPHSLQHVATLFFGGPDDREALACSRRIAMHPHLSLTVIRFLCAASSSLSIQNYKNGSNDDEDEDFKSISSRNNAEDVRDNAFVQDFYDRDVSSGQVDYVEKYVKNGAQTVEAIRDLGDAYSLLVVGKGGRGHSPMTAGISDWEECPELGAVGDFLASMDFEINSSILVIQQHRYSKEEDLIIKE